MSAQHNTAQHSTAQHSTAQHSTAQISFVVPVYNVKPYLVRCLESIIRTNVEKEIILIDDGSTDGSREILEQYLQKYPYITLVCQSNRGVSAARNVGIKLAKGEYIQFVDPDDFLLTTDYAYLITMAKSANADILRGLYCNIFPDGQVTSASQPITLPYSQIPANTRTINSDGRSFLIQGTKRYLPVIWLGFFSTKLLQENQIFFNESLPASEDQIFFLDVLMLKNIKIIEVLQPIYGYYMNLLSTTRKQNIQFTQNMFNACHLIWNRYHKENDSEIKSAIYRILLWNYNILYKDHYLKYSDAIREQIKDLFTDEIIQMLEENLDYQVKF